MKGNLKAIEQARTIFIVFCVVLVGLGLFYAGISYLYKGELNKGACDLCFELNPGVSHCENYTEINLSNIYIIEYG